MLGSIKLLHMTVIMHNALHCCPAIVSGFHFMGLTRQCFQPHKFHHKKLDFDLWLIVMSHDFLILPTSRWSKQQLLLLYASGSFIAYA